MSLRRGLTALILLAAFSGFGAAQDETPQEAPPPRPMRTARAAPSEDIRLEKLWFERRADMEAGDSASAAGKIEEMERIVRSERLDRVSWLARGFSYEGFVHLREGNYERAREAFDIARRFDPRLAEAQTGYAWAALRAGRGVATFQREYRKALGLRWENFKREGTANLYVLAMAALWLMAVLIVALLVLRYNALLRHDVAEALPSGWPDGASRLAGHVVLFAPLLLWFGGVWLLYYWCALLARYMTGSERILAGLACAGMILTGPLAQEGTSAAETSANPTVVAVESALQGGYGADVIRELQAAITPQTPALRLLLANAYERANLHREAFEEYQGLLRIAPDNASALNNVGNLYMRNGQSGQGAVYYTKAAEADPTQAIFFHNLFLAQSDAVRLADAEQSIQRVQELDPNLAKALVFARDRGEEIKPITASPATEAVWNDLSAGTGPPEKRLSSYMRAPTVIGALAAMALMAWASLSRNPLRAQACQRCGEPFCGRCKRELGAKECCAPCIHLFVKKDSIAPEARAQKLTQVERHLRGSRLKVRLATLLLPGAGHLLAGRTVSGGLLLALWTAPLTFLLLGGRLILASSLPVLALPGFSTLVILLFMAILWAAANLLAPRPAR